MIHFISMSFDQKELQAVELALSDNFDHREQYYLEQYSLLCDLKVCNKQACINHNLYKYLQLEELLDTQSLHDFVNIYRKYIEEPSDNVLKLISNIYKFNRTQIYSIFNCLSRKYNKKRTLIFYGESNTGKSLLARSLLLPFVPGFILRDGGTNVHWLEDIYRKSFILWEEPSIHMTNIEDVKLLLAGEKIAINRKNKPIITRINNPSVIVTTNREFWEYDYTPIINRSLLFTFNTLIHDDCIKLKESWILYYLISIYDGRQYKY